MITIFEEFNYVPDNDKIEARKIIHMEKKNGKMRNNYDN